ncbi:MAG: hypothetical protein HY706_11220 [Candidatus Hydrogenedentes bacterium]|nr:hypothetical protein [Candidatus Hydrogenedentota bacterium]
MERTIRKKVVIQSGGRINVQSPDLPEGAEAEVIIILQNKLAAQSYRSLFGSGKGAFAFSEEADAFLRQERDAWED